MADIDENFKKRPLKVKGQSPVTGEGGGEVMATDVSISFWGGINQDDGTIIDKYHPLKGESVKDKIFVLPKGKGSSTGSGVLLEMILSGCAPSGIILNEKDEIIILGGIVASEAFLKEIPIVILNDDDFKTALRSSYAKIDRNGFATLTFEKGTDHERH